MVKIAAIQFESSPDVEENLQRASHHVTRAAKNGAKLVCLPEYFYSNQPLRHLVKHAAKTDSLIENRLDNLARLLKIFIVYNVPKYHPGKKTVTNTSIVAGPHAQLGAYAKTCLFPNKPFNETDYFAAGKSAPVFDCGFAKIGIAICYDFRFPEIGRELAFGGAEILFVPAAFPKDKLNQWRTLLAARAIENQLFVVGVNKTGTDEKSTYAASTMFLSPKGNVIAEGKGRKEQIVYAQIDLREMKKLRQKVSYLNSARVFY